MIQRDYMERMIEQIAELIAKLTGLPLHARSSYIAEVSVETLRIDPKDLEKINNKDLIDYLIDKNLNIFQIEFLAILLFEEIKANKALDLEVEKKIEKALLLFEYVFDKSEEYNLELRDMHSQLVNLINEKK